MNLQSRASAPKWVLVAASVVPHLRAGRYRILGTLSRRPPAPFLMRMPAELGGDSYVCDLRDSIAREVCFTGQYGPQESLLIRSLIRPGMTFVDVGANWGYFTLMALRLVGPSGHVLSLEPDPRLFDLLTENVVRNEFASRGLLQVAAAAEPGELLLAGYDEQDGNFGLSRIVEQAGPHGPHFRVEAAPLDQILASHGVNHVDLLKMDIEGAEFLALSGLRESLRRRVVRALLIELHPAALRENGSSVEEVSAMLRAAGYEGHTVDHAPAVTRAVAYGQVTDASSLLRPLKETDSLDAWPHQLWLAPGAVVKW